MLSYGLRLLIPDFSMVEIEELFKEMPDTATQAELSERAIKFCRKLVRLWANALTLTNDNFANFLHRDRDHIPATFGLWWVVYHKKFKKFWFNDQIDHKNVSGGQFVWGAYGVAIDFPK